MKTEDLDRMDDEFVNAKFDAMQEFVKSKLHYWKQIPKLYYIKDGKSGYNSNRILSQLKLYTLDTLGSGHGNGTLIDCVTGDFIRLRFGHDKILCSSQNYWKNDVVKSLIYFNRNIDGERIAQLFMEDIVKTKHSNLNPILPIEWISEAIKYDIDISFEDYKLHYDIKGVNSYSDDFEMTESQFKELFEELTIKLVRENLVGIK